jgi:hypothetical protein
MLIACTEYAVHASTMVLGTQGFALLRRTVLVHATGERIPVHRHNVVDVLVRVPIHQNSTRETLPGPGGGLA